MDMLVCPKCKLRVIPKADGTCPSCQAPLKAAASRVVQKAAGPAREASPRPVDAGSPELTPSRPARTPRPASSASRSTRRPVKLTYGEVLCTAARIAWRHKVLWLALFLVYLFIFSALLWFDPAYWPILLAWVLLGAALGTIATLMCILGTLRVEKGQESLRLGELVRASWPYFWRMVGTWLLATLATCIAILPFACTLSFLFVAISGAAPSGTAAVVLNLVWSMPVSLLTVAFTQQCYQAAVVEDNGVMDAIGRGWQVFRENLTSTVVMALCLFLVFSPFYLLILAEEPLSRLIPAFAEGDPVAWFTSPGGGWLIGFLLVLFILISWLMVFYQSAWTVTFLRLTRRPAGKA